MLRALHRIVGARNIWLPPKLSKEQEQLRAELANCLVSPEAAAELRGYLEECFRRLLTTLEMVPAGEGRVLELGANPYFLTMLLRRFRRFDLQLANYFGGHGDNVQRIRNERTGESQEFRYKEFNIETEDFPYPDGHFDGVLYCEIIEHLVQDPIAVFAEIHRVLKPGGWVLVTTPNVARRHNLLRLERGENLYDPYSGYGPYGRHNREYTAGELRELLANTGFTVERLITRDLHPCNRRSQLLALALGPGSGFNLYLLARRQADFRWYYPGWLFRSGLPRRRVREPFIRMGVNDPVQLGTGWWDLEQWPDGPMRWTQSRAEAFVRVRGDERRLRLLVCGGPGARRSNPKMTIRIDAADLEGPVNMAAQAPRDAWIWLELPLPRPLPPGEIKLTLESPTFVPSDVAGGADKRELGIGLREMEAMA